MRNILITGDPGAGKSTLLAKVIRRMRSFVGGAVTVEIKRADERVGFAVKVIGKDDEYVLAHIDSDSPFRVGRYGVDTSVIERMTLSVSFARAAKQVLVVDEVGLMQIASGSFRNMVNDVLESDRIVILSVPTHDHPFVNEIKARPDVQIHHVTEENRDELFGEIVAQLYELLG